MQSWSSLACSFIDSVTVSWASLMRRVSLFYSEISECVLNSLLWAAKNWITVLTSCKSWSDLRLSYLGERVLVTPVPCIVLETSDGYSYCCVCGINGPSAVAETFRGDTEDFVAKEVSIRCALIVSLRLKMCLPTSCVT